ncbi:MAG: NUDIX domain-containing protein [Armatimonadetes bacterium]|nr:MAG: NUDIX domain-containing protein [Armatimonadota bacterium]
MRLEFSAGGVVYKREKTRKGDDKRKNAKGIYILVSQHSMHHGWVFPKGLIGDHIEGEKKSASAKGFGETKEEAAVREVKEETGIEAKIIRALEPVTYWYVLEGEKIKKTVYYYIMEFIGGDTEKRDFEMENVEWLPIDEVLERLSYKSDKKVFEIAKEVIKKLVIE